jgi:glycerophosphoryl diester phosphodiesterase
MKTKKLPIAIWLAMISSTVWPAGLELEVPIGIIEPLIVAHRGACRDAPENTIPAFMLAWDQQADAIEGDFRLTKDGHIVCIHDADTKKVAAKNLVIENSTLKQLRELDVGSHHSKEFKGTVIPTIAEVFSTVPKKKKIYIEVKCGVEIVDKLLEEIEKSGLKREQIVVISFDSEVVAELKARSPQLKALLVVSFKRNKFLRITPSRKLVMESLAQTKADGLSSKKDLVSKAFIKKVISSGYEYHVWTIDDLKTAKRFKEWGAKSITTNIPGFMKKKLNGKTSQMPTVDN